MFERPEEAPAGVVRLEERGVDLTAATQAVTAALAQALEALDGMRLKDASAEVSGRTARSIARILPSAETLRIRLRFMGTRCLVWRCFALTMDK